MSQWVFPFAWQQVSVLQRCMEILEDWIQLIWFLMPPNCQFCFSLIFGWNSLTHKVYCIFLVGFDGLTQWGFSSLLWFKNLIMHINLILSSLQFYKLLFKVITPMIFIYYLCSWITFYSQEYIIHRQHLHVPARILTYLISYSVFHFVDVQWY